MPTVRSPSHGGTMVEGRHPEVRNTEGASGIRSDGRPDEAPPDALGISAPAVPSTVPEARRLLVAFAARHSAGETVLRDMALVVTEAVTNVVVHAYEPGVAGGVDVIADIKDGALEVLVVDHGLGFAQAGQTVSVSRPSPLRPRAFPSPSATPAAQRSGCASSCTTDPSLSRPAQAARRGCQPRGPARVPHPAWRRRCGRHGARRPRQRATSWPGTTRKRSKLVRTSSYAAIDNDSVVLHPTRPHSHMNTSAPSPDPRPRSIASLTRRRLISAHATRRSHAGSERSTGGSGGTAPCCPIDTSWPTRRAVRRQARRATASKQEQRRPVARCGRGQAKAEARRPWLAVSLRVRCDRRFRWEL